MAAIAAEEYDPGAEGDEAALTAIGEKPAVTNDENSDSDADDDEEEDDIDIVLDKETVENRAKGQRYHVLAPNTKFSIKRPGAPTASSASASAAGATPHAGGAARPQNSRSIFDVSISELNLTERPWLAPGSDITDYFNYGFNEETWEQYRQKQTQLRLEQSMQGRIRVYESHKENLNNLPPELRNIAAAQNPAVADSQSSLANQNGGGVSQSDYAPSQSGSATSYAQSQRKPAGSYQGGYRRAQSENPGYASQPDWNNSSGRAPSYERRRHYRQQDDAVVDLSGNSVAGGGGDIGGGGGSDSLVLAGGAGDTDGDNGGAPYYPPVLGMMPQPPIYGLPPPHEMAHAPPHHPAYGVPPQAHRRMPSGGYHENGAPPPGVDQFGRSYPQHMQSGRSDGGRPPYDGNPRGGRPGDKERPWGGRGDEEDGRGRGRSGDGGYGDRRGGGGSGGGGPLRRDGGDRYDPSPYKRPPFRS